MFKIELKDLMEDNKILWAECEYVGPFIKWYLSDFRNVPEEGIEKNFTTKFFFNI